MLDVVGCGIGRVRPRACALQAEMYKAPDGSIIRKGLPPMQSGALLKLNPSEGNLCPDGSSEGGGTPGSAPRVSVPGTGPRTAQLMSQHVSNLVGLVSNPLAPPATSSQGLPPSLQPVAPTSGQHPTSASVPQGSPSRTRLSLMGTAVTAPATAAGTAPGASRTGGPHAGQAGAVAAAPSSSLSNSVFARSGTSTSLAGGGGSGFLGASLGSKPTVVIPAPTLDGGGAPMSSPGAGLHSNPSLLGGNGTSGSSTDKGLAPSISGSLSGSPSLVPGPQPLSGSFTGGGGSGTLTGGAPSSRFSRASLWMNLKAHSHTGANPAPSQLQPPAPLQSPSRTGTHHTPHSTQ